MEKMWKKEEEDDWLNGHDKKPDKELDSGILLSPSGGSGANIEYRNPPRDTFYRIRGLEMSIIIIIIIIAHRYSRDSYEIHMK